MGKPIVTTPCTELPIMPYLIRHAFSALMCESARPRSRRSAAPMGLVSICAMDCQGDIFKDRRNALRSPRASTGSSSQRCGQKYCRGGGAGNTYISPAPLHPILRLSPHCEEAATGCNPAQHIHFPRDPAIHYRATISTCGLRARTCGPFTRRK